MATVSKKPTRATPKRRRRSKPVWDVNVPIVKSAAEAKMLLKKTERSLARHYQEHPLQPRCEPGSDYTFDF